VAFWSVAFEVADGLVLDGFVLVWLVAVEFMLLFELVPAAPAPVELAVSLPVQDSEIMLTELTCSEPPLDCVPCTST
jgi:hypothetical protein